MSNVNQQQLDRVFKQVALKAGVSAEDVMRWPTERLQPYLDEMIQQAESGVRVTARQMAFAAWTADLLRESGMPEGMSLGEGLERGYFSLSLPRSIATEWDDHGDAAVYTKLESCSPEQLAGAIEHVHAQIEGLQKHIIALTLYADGSIGFSEDEENGA